MTVKTTKYIKEANFINEEKEVEMDWWPRDPYRYDPTNAWRNRIKELDGIVGSEDIQEAIQLGDMYKSANDTLTFVNDLGGLVIYVVVDAQLQKRGDSYPTNPTMEDYWFKGVTVWPYIYDRDKAWSTGRWTGDDLDKVEQMVEDNMEKFL